MSRGLHESVERGCLGTVIAVSIENGLDEAPPVGLGQIPKRSGQSLGAYSTPAVYVFRLLLQFQTLDTGFLRPRPNPACQQEKIWPWTGPKQQHLPNVWLKGNRMLSTNQVPKFETEVVAPQKT